MWSFCFHIKQTENSLNGTSFLIKASDANCGPHVECQIWSNSSHVKSFIGLFLSDGIIAKASTEQPCHWAVFS